MPVGLLMVNLGSPDAPTPEATRRYLGQFLHDYRVVDTSRWIWCPILHGVILRIRPTRSAKAYASIWGEDGTEAPLVRITRSQVAGVQDRLGDAVRVETAMRYGNPSIDAGLEKLMAAGCTKIAVLPLYPQYAGATTASVYDGVAKALVGKWNVPELRFLRDYYREPAFIGSLANSLSDHFGTIDWTPDRILCSYHGLPQTYVDAGDPYQDECLETTDLLRAHTGYSETVLQSTFQSRFGPKAWLQPYTDKTLEALPEQGIKKVAVMMPGFSADCLETLEEIAIEAEETFLEAGGTHFTTVPCLNDRRDHINMLADIARNRLLNGWLDQGE
ncbi:ferrochelatase [Algimonas arctica]|uniref:Ferrochelatase n=1 Tax=Algimonas arctica TaxID=1479486 RepID=A0A8J3CQ06_9PROT|nr:ferrochelatase [Algimonas arctica]GHA83969.1 ferrochelatase [Algimonas arctica]